MVRMIWGSSKSQPSSSLAISKEQSVSLKSQLPPLHHPVGLEVVRGDVTLPHTPEGTQLSHESRLKLPPGQCGFVTGPLDSRRPSLPEPQQWSQLSRSVLGGRLSIW